MIFRNHSNMLIWCSWNISDYYYQWWKQLCCFIFLWKPWYICFRILWWIESSNEQHLFEREIICNMINVFTVTFEQFNASLLNKNTHFFTFERYCKEVKFIIDVLFKSDRKNITLSINNNDFFLQSPHTTARRRHIHQWRQLLPAGAGGKRVCVLAKDRERTTRVRIHDNQIKTSLWYSTLFYNA